MSRLTQSLIAGGIVASIAGIMMRRQRSNSMNMNKYMNTAINMAAKLGLFKMIGTSRLFKNMAKMR